MIKSCMYMLFIISLATTPFMAGSQSITGNNRWSGKRTTYHTARPPYKKRTQPTVSHQDFRKKAKKE